MLIKLWTRRGRRYDIRNDEMATGVWRLCLRLRWPFAAGWSLEKDRG